MNGEFNVYQRNAMRTLSEECKQDPDKALLNAVLGLCGEAGEVADHVKKHLFHGHVLHCEKLIDELGDIQWYLAEAAWALDTLLSYVADTNIAKLIKRYPEGFSSERSINRAE